MNVQHAADSITGVPAAAPNSEAKLAKVHDHETQC